MNIHRKEKGFTIIEVVLVLAIAGLIFLMVFIALPALQRSQRDTQRKNDLSRIVTALASYQSNNRGSLPDAGSSDPNQTWAGFVTRYIRTAGDTFVDPSGEDYIVSVGEDAPATFSATTPNIVVVLNSKCDGEGTLDAQGSRKVAFLMKLEGSGVTCQNN